LVGPGGDRDTGAETRRRTYDGIAHRGAWPLATEAREDDPARRVQRWPQFRVAGRTHQATGGGAAVHRRRVGQGPRSLWAVRRHDRALGRRRALEATMNFNALDVSILAPAFIAGLLVLATHVPLGIQVLSRGIVFIDLAIAQVAGIGVIAADAAGWEPQGWAVQIAAVAAALAGAVLLTYTEKRWPEV